MGEKGTGGRIRERRRRGRGGAGERGKGLGGREGSSWQRVWLTAGEERGSEGERGGELVGRGRRDSKAAGRGRRDPAKGRRGGRGQPVWGRLGMFYLEGWRDRDMPRPLSPLARSGAACSTANHPEASHLPPPASRPARAIAPPPLLSPPRASPQPLAPTAVHSQPARRPKGGERDGGSALCVGIEESQCVARAAGHRRRRLPSAGLTPFEGTPHPEPLKTIFLCYLQGTRSPG